jgi:hypothetical protein
MKQAALAPRGQRDFIEFWPSGGAEQYRIGGRKRRLGRSGNTEPYLRYASAP